MTRRNTSANANANEPPPSSDHDGYLQKQEKKSFMVFKYCAKRCLDCAECGYVWGPGHPAPGTKPYWRTK